MKRQVIKLTEEIEKDPKKYSSWIIQSLGDKADKNKFRARWIGILSVLLSSLVVFILMFDDLSIWSATAAAVTIINSGILAWLQLEKPYDRWRLYRKYHRITEAARVNFLNSIPPYDGTNAEKIFISELVNLQTRLHFEWDGLIPSTEDIENLQKGT